MAFYPRSMFLDDADVQTRSSYNTHRGLDRFSRRKSRSDISSDYEQDHLGLLRAKSDFVRSDYPRPTGLMRSASDFDAYDRTPSVAPHDLEYDYDDEFDRDAREYRVEYINDLNNAKLRRRKSFKRMFEVPSGITNLFDGSRERERRYFNAGGRFALHTLLDAHAVRTGAPHLKFDILRPKDIRIVGDSYQDPRALDEPATFPAISKLRILVADLPWIIRVQNREGVTLRDIANAVCAFFHTEMNPREWSMLDGAHKVAARRAFSMQQHGGMASGGLRRFECLVDTTMFMGVVKNDALVKRVAGDDAVEWTWVMLGPR